MLCGERCVNIILSSLKPFFFMSSGTDVFKFKINITGTTLV